MLLLPMMRVIDTETELRISKSGKKSTRMKLSREGDAEMCYAPLMSVMIVMMRVM